MSGLAILLGDRRTPHSTLYAGRRTWTAHRRVELNKAMQESASLQASLLKFVHVFMVQTAHTAIANARTKLDERLARWILMAHDRLDDRSMPLTHEFLSLMLGVRRAGVTEALQDLTAQKLIQSARGSVVVLNRKGIERMAGAAYGTPEAEYRRLIR
jgi:CRP-like cAMP-binding protein